MAVSGTLAVWRRTERRSTSEKEIHFDTSGRGRDGIILDVERDGSLLWSGVFAFGQIGCDAVAFVGHSGHVLVVARGQGYLLDVASPMEWSALPVFDIRQVISAPSIEGAAGCNLDRLFVIWNIDRIGIRHLDADGIYDLAILDDRLTGYFEHVSHGGAIEQFEFALTEAEFPRS